MMKNDGCRSALLLREDAGPVLARYAADAFVLDSYNKVWWLNHSHAPQRHQA
jgi:hypothetical protein